MALPSCNKFRLLVSRLKTVITSQCLTGTYKNIFKFYTEKHKSSKTVQLTNKYPNEMVRILYTISANTINRCMVLKVYS